VRITGIEEETENLEGILVMIGTATEKIGTTETEIGIVTGTGMTDETEIVVGTTEEIQAAIEI
jgi:hypothetical protein